MQLARTEVEEPWIEVARRATLGMSPDAWSPARREQFLLRSDVPQPLSVDGRVWPVATGADGVNVAISILLRDLRADGRDMWLPRALRIEADATLLGYDVADEVMTSGLSNCGYSDEEKKLLRPIWAQQLNRFHLFDRSEGALQFKGITEARVPEHAPFFVFGIYLLSAGNEPEPG
jgi:hypothetical protein